MSGASSNAAARRRRAAPPANMNRMRQSQQVPPKVQQSVSHISNQSSNAFNTSNTISTEGLPTKNGKMLHPVEILKLFNERLNTLESNSNNSQSSSSNLDTRLINSLTTQMGEMKRKTQEQLGEISEVKRNVEMQLKDKLIEFEEKINTFNNQIEEMKELCSKIQTFSMETNVSFMLFKNEYDKMRQGSNALSFMNVFNQFENMGDDVSMEMDDHSLSESNVIIDGDDVEEEDVNLAVEDAENDEEDMSLQNVESNIQVEVEEVVTNISDVIASIDRSDTPISIHSNVVEVLDE